MDTALGAESMNRVLMIAYHFPPFVGSSGVQRTLGFVRHLQSWGWQPGVLTVHPWVYSHTDRAGLEQIPYGIPVWRSYALDAARHLSLFHRYPSSLAMPDRWASWIPAGVMSGLAAISRFRPQVIWSTYPIASAHVIGGILARLTALPWIADFRDPMVQPEHRYPTDPLTRAGWGKIERWAANYAQRCVFTTPGTLQRYQQRFPKVPSWRWTIIENGFTEEAFDHHGDLEPHARSPLRLVHAGVLYPRERNPLPFFEALRRLKLANAIAVDSLRVILRGSGHDSIYDHQLVDLGVDDIVRLEPPVPHRQAIRELLQAHGLLLFQGRTCSDQIPAKVYEYLRTDRPILALTNETGDTGKLLCDQPGVWVVPMENATEIENALRSMLAAIQQGQLRYVRPKPEKWSRRLKTRELAKLMDAVIDLTGKRH